MRNIEVLRNHVESRGFWLGEHPTLLAGPPPLVICEHPPDRKEQWVVAIFANNLFDSLSALPTGSFRCEARPLQEPETYPSFMPGINDVIDMADKAISLMQEKI